MTRLITAVLLTATVGLVTNPVPADAQGTSLEHEFVKCAKEVEEGCKAEFPSNDWISTGARGWCYIIRIAQCMGGAKNPDTETDPQTT